MTEDEPNVHPPPEPVSNWASEKDRRLTPYGSANLGSSLALIDGLLTPIPLFFVRSNYAVPRLDPSHWWLEVGGLVERPLRLSLTDLRAMPRRSLVAFLECSGNSRTRFEPAAEGTPWLEDAVGNAEWTGVEVRHILAQAGVRPEAIQMVSQGGDSPEMRRGLPLGVALDPDTLIVWEMNGEALPNAHGGPARLLVPGWGGIASTKWLVGLELIDHRFDGYWNAANYVLLDEAGRETGRVERMPVKSVIATPATGARLDSGDLVVAGSAWSGKGAVAAVDVSTDGGESYHPAEITEQAGPRSWVRFEYRWQAASGVHRLRSRATDELGEVQPEVAPWNAKGYQMNAIYEVQVEVRAPSRTVVDR